MYEVSKAAQVGCVMKQYRIEILGLSEIRWIRIGKVKISTGEIIIYSGLPNPHEEHIKAVGIMMSERAVKTLIEWHPVSERIIKERFKSKFIM
jgi:hypothetical protein